MAGADPILCLALGAAVPGGGHLLLGERRRGLLYLGLLVGTFAFGVILSRGHAVSLSQHPVAFIVQVLCGAPTLLAALVDFLRNSPLPGVDAVAVLDLGILFTAIPGLLNVLVAYDAYEHAVHRRQA